MFPYVQNNFKVVEINNVRALYTGTIIAQAPLAKADTFAAVNYIENGRFFVLDVDGELKARADVSDVRLLNQAPILHYTEELFTGPLTNLKEFALDWESDNVCYPRGLVLSIGDTFVTNNFAGSFNAAHVVATLNAAGILVPAATIPATVAGGYVGPVFGLVATTLPDGETDAFQVTYLGNIVIAAA